MARKYMIVVIPINFCGGNLILFFLIQGELFGPHKKLYIPVVVRPCNRVD